ncbi:MAG TPA: hypothetical protein VNZ05_06540 [Solirubrobacteraceae bacterium]|jgi:hypothetical protein|nr:hypothetical protein [Solirubrobacteraceae bacterium]
MRVSLALIVCAALCLAPAGAAAAAQTSAAHSSSETGPVPVPASNVPPAGRRLSANQVLAIAAGLPKMKAVRAKYPGSYGGAYLKPAFHWQVSYFSRGGKKEIGQVIIEDVSGRVLEQWTGFQVAWTMARGYPGAFGRSVNALYIWLPLCVLFVLPFINFRRPFSLLHLDLLVLLSFSVSLAFFNRARIYASVPLAYPPLLYLLARMLALSRPRRPRRPLRLLVPASWLAVAVVFLLGFRIALNVIDSNVIDVGYAGVIGAQRLVHGKPLYGSYPADNEHGDTYGPVNYEAYVPFQQIFGWSGKWDDLPAAHAAAICFDLLALGLLFMLGRRVRGPTLGIALAYAWVAYPFTLFALENNANDTLVAVLVLAALLVAGSPAARGAMGALAGLTKFAPLALAPLLATHGLWRAPAAGAGVDGVVSAPLPWRARVRALALFTAAFALVGAVAAIPALSHDTLHTIYERTLAYQANRGSPFSVWGLYGGLRGAQAAVQIAAVALAAALALAGRGRDLVALAAACAAVIIAVQLGIDHWFYLYIVWFVPLVLLALLGGFSPLPRRAPAAASEPARSSRPAVVVSSG